MSDVFLWAISGALGLLFLLVNYSNGRLLLGHYRRADGSNPSPVLFVGGIAGAVACAVAPNETLRDFFWVALVVDLGTGPYVLLAAILFAVAAASATSSDKAEPERVPPPNERAIVGCILGTAVGDALGLALEGLSRQRQPRMFSDLANYKLLPFGKGLCSDDTEHTCLLAESLIQTAGYADPEEMARRFGSNFAWRLRFWLLGLPAGIGLATLRAILKLWIGFPARYSGVFSAGNGPAMRVALIGVCYGGDAPRMRALVRAATRITHTDPKAEHGALAVALAAHLSALGGVAPAEYARRLRELLGEDGRELLELVDEVARSVAAKESAADYANRMGWAKGVSGYMLHTVPAALHVWLSHQDEYRGGVTTVIRLGGDTDTAAAIVGAIIGARVGKEGIPREWLDNLWEWPRTKAWMEGLGRLLALRSTDHSNATARGVSTLKLLFRNALFIPLVLAHGFRRMLPPY
jgi:ADP-ribosyl-[dinitrogen reductase] hydrolase